MRIFSILFALTIAGCVSNETDVMRITYGRDLTNLREYERYEFSFRSIGSRGWSGLILVFEGSEPDKVAIYEHSLVPSSIESEEVASRPIHDKGKLLGVASLTKKELREMNAFLAAYPNTWGLPIGSLKYDVSIRHYAANWLLSEEYYYQYMPEEHDLALSAFLYKIEQVAVVNASAAAGKAENHLHD